MMITSSPPPCRGFESTRDENKNDDEKPNSSSSWPLILQLWKKRTTMMTSLVHCHYGFKSTHDEKKDENKPSSLSWPSLL
jgi:hypothetical protein